MIFDVECPKCYGCGRIHSPNKNGDPDDEGLVCDMCEGAGVIETDLEDEIDE
jgi:hypothetical protein